MTKQMSISAIEKDIAYKRSQIIYRVNFFPKDSGLKSVKMKFDLAFKEARSIINKPVSKWGNSIFKRNDLIPVYYQIIDLAEVSYQMWNRLTKIAPEIKEEIVLPLANDLQEQKSNAEVEQMNNTPEIKPQENPENEDMKRGSEIKEGQVSLSLRGGSRPGAGRKPIGVTRKISMTLPAEDWAYIDGLIEKGQVKNVADYFRQSTGLGSTVNNDG